VVDECLSEFQPWPLLLCFLPLQSSGFGTSRLLFALFRYTHLLLLHLALLPFPYAFTCSQSLESLLRLAQLFMSPLSLLHHPRVSLFQLQPAAGHKIFIEVLVLHAIDARICGRRDFNAVLELEEKHLGEDDIVVRVCHLDAVSEGTGWRGWPGVII